MAKINKERFTDIIEIIGVDTGDNERTRAKPETRWLWFWHAKSRNGEILYFCETSWDLDHPIHTAYRHAVELGLTVPVVAAVLREQATQLKDVAMLTDNYDKRYSYGNIRIKIRHMRDATPQAATGNEDNSG